MEARRPRLARFSGVAAIVLSGLTLINAFAGRWPGHTGLKFRIQPYVLARLDRFDGMWWEPTGWYHQETVAAVAVVALLIVRKRASRPRSVPTLQQRSISDQLESFESGGITVRSAPQLGGASATTQAIVQSILGNEPEAQRDVSAAIAHLDTDETGQEAARMVAAAKNPQPAIVREAPPMEAAPSLDIALPTMDEAPTAPELPAEPEAPASAPESVTSAPVTSVPLPVLPKPTPALAPAPVEQPKTDDPGLDGLLDGLDRLFDEPVEDAQHSVDDDGMGDLLDSLDDLF